MVAKEAVKTVVGLPAPLTEDSNKANIGLSKVQFGPKADTWTPTRQDDSPRIVDSMVTPSSTIPRHTEDTGFGPGYEHPFWALMNEAGYM